MSTEEGSECAEGGDSDQQIAPENDRDDSIAGNTQFRSASSELLKAVYYWVLSRT